LGAVSRLRAGRAAELGRAGESAAAHLLRSRGYQVVGKGFLARRGEIDLVCRRGDAMVVVEVKTRTGDEFGTPLEAIGPRKRRALMAAAAEYRALSEWRGKLRFAVVCVTVRPDGGLVADLVEDPFG
jgi:putative endonuclease